MDRILRTNHKTPYVILVAPILVGGPHFRQSNKVWLEGRCIWRSTSHQSPLSNYYIQVLQVRWVWLSWRFDISPWSFTRPCLLFCSSLGANTWSFHQRTELTVMISSLDLHHRRSVQSSDLIDSHKLIAGMRSQESH